MLFEMGRVELEGLDDELFSAIEKEDIQITMRSRIACVLDRVMRQW